LLCGSLPSALQLLMLYLGEPFGSPFLVLSDHRKIKKSVTRKRHGLT
jgi:hypothetical protein